MSPTWNSFSIDRPHRMDGFLGRIGPKNDAFDLEKNLESGPKNLGFLAVERARKLCPQLGIDDFLGSLGPKNDVFDLEKISRKSNLYFFL